MISKSILLLAFSCIIAVSGDGYTQRIYTELRYQVSSPGWLRERKDAQTVLVTGSAWVIDIGPEKVFVTAAHNAGLGPRGTPERIGEHVIKGETKATLTGLKTLIGTLGYEVNAIGTASSEDDILFLRADPAAFSNSRTVKLARRDPKPGDQVKILGYPRTSHEHQRECLIAAVYAKHFVLNEPAEPGYSGGLVLNSSGDAIGLITGTDQKQATAVFVPVEALKTIHWVKSLDELTGSKLISTIK
jgi:hypothetical protein